MNYDISDFIEYMVIKGQTLEDLEDFLPYYQNQLSHDANHDAYIQFCVPQCLVNYKDSD